MATYMLHLAERDEQISSNRQEPISMVQAIQVVREQIEQKIEITKKSGIPEGMQKPMAIEMIAGNASDAAKKTFAKKDINTTRQALATELSRGISRTVSPEQIKPDFAHRLLQKARQTGHILVGQEVDADLAAGISEGLVARKIETLKPELFTRTQPMQLEAIAREIISEKALRPNKQKPAVGHAAKPAGRLMESRRPQREIKPQQPQGFVARLVDTIRNSLKSIIPDRTSRKETQQPARPVTRTAVEYSAASHATEPSAQLKQQPATEPATFDFHAPAEQTAGIHSSFADATDAPSVIVENTREAKNDEVFDEVFSENLNDAAELVMEGR